MTDTDKRIAALEERIAHQDHIIEDLSDMSVKQWKEISELSDKLGYLKSKLEELEDGGEESPGKEPPAAALLTCFRSERHPKHHPFVPSINRTRTSGIRCFRGAAHLRVSRDRRRPYAPSASPWCHLNRST